MKKMIAALVAIACLFSVALADFTVYPLTGKIVSIDYAEDLVVFVDGGGTLWEFYGVEDYFVGDFISCIVWNAGTLKIYDDEIIDVVYAGVFE